MPRRTLAKVETVVYKGITFRRYPESPNLSERSYFKPNGVHAAQGVRSLHREIWKDHHGAIPQGYHIHHRDGNPGNNAIENLECLPPKAHMGKHMTQERRERSRQAIKKAIAAAAVSEWRRSEAGHMWHVEHARKMGFGHNPVADHTCQQCGKVYQSTKMTNTRFCSNNCKAAARRASGVDDIPRTCDSCGAEFICNRYSYRRFCDGICAKAYRLKSK